MNPDISERAFESAIECGLLQYGPDLPAASAAQAGACAGVATASPYGDNPPGGPWR